MEVGQGRVQTGVSVGSDSVETSSPILQLEDCDTWGERFEDALLNGADTIMTEELPNNPHSHLLGLETIGREMVASLQQETEKLRDQLRTYRAKLKALKIRERSSRAQLKASRTKERASRARERASRAELRAKEEENREMQSVLLNMIARLSTPEP